MKIINELADLANKAKISGQGTPEMVEFRVVANPDNILAIAEAFRVLEQRAEAAEAKLAERDKQEPAAFTSEYYWSELNTFGAVKCVLLKNGNDPDFQVELFTRPARAADLVPEGWILVPVEPTKQMLEASYREASVYSPTAYRAMLAAAPTPNE